MTIRPIIEVPDKRLRTISKPVDAVTDEMRVLMDDMLETMYDAKGIGLAAIQVGVAQRIIVMDLSPSLEDADAATEDETSADDFDNESASKQDRYDLSSYAHEGPRYFVNPEIVWASEETNNYQEGCLFVPGFMMMWRVRRNAASNSSIMTARRRRLTATGFGDLHPA